MSLQRYVRKPKARDAQNNVWILEITWRLVNERVSVRWDPARYEPFIQCLGRAIPESLKGDRKRKAEEAGEEVEKFLESNPHSTRNLGTG